jgi:CRISPR-associated endonuclease/helicase Cas3
MICGAIPQHLDIPTGLGKTSILPIWIIARAVNYNLPNRLIYVVDRRAVVDQATQEADRLANLLVPGVTGILATVRHELGLGERAPLPVSTLRGQHADNRAWLADPSLPAIIVGTVDMIGSRLLFEGYGVSRRMRPYHAALLGHDALLVLDEAHLVPPFEALVRQVASGAATYGPKGTTLPRAPLQALSLSATGRGAVAATFQLDGADLAHPIVAQRLHARKELRIHHDPVARNSVAAELAKLAWLRSQDSLSSSRMIVFCNSRAVAGATRVEIEKLASKAPHTVELLVGERRVHERQRVEEWLKLHGFVAGGDHTETTGLAFLIATAAGEVGVDLDADHMVCDLVAWERMVQRLGRTNRRGKGAAIVDVLLVALDKPDAPTEYERRAAACAEVLRRLPALPEVGLDGSPGALSALAVQGRADTELASLLRRATTPAPLRPALTRALVDAWSLTSLHQHPGRPEIGPWLRGWEEQEPQTRVIWRHFLPWHTEDAAPRAAEVEAFFSAAGPQQIETLEAPVWATLDTLRKRATAIVAESPREKRFPAVIILSSAGESEGSLTLDQLVRFRPDDGPRRMADRTLVVTARLGGLSEDGLLDAGCKDAPTTLDGEAGLAADRLLILRHQIGEPPPVVAAGGWTRAYGWPSRYTAEGEPAEEVVVYVADAGSAEPALARHLQRLDDHAAAAEQHARAIAARLGLPEVLTEMLATATRRHDDGKKREPWQSAFGAPTNGRPYAKTTARWVNQALLGGYRHEFGSLADAEVDTGLQALPADLRQLALHLITAHHGLGRPLITPLDPETPPSVLRARAGEVALRFAALQRQWGPWGLVWWEALLRAVDARASRENDGEQL